MTGNELHGRCASSARACTQRSGFPLSASRLSDGKAGFGANGKGCLRSQSVALGLMNIVRGYFTACCRALQGLQSYCLTGRDIRLNNRRFRVLKQVGARECVQAQQIVLLGASVETGLVVRHPKPRRALVGSGNGSRADERWWLVGSQLLSVYYSGVTWELPLLLRCWGRVCAKLWRRKLRGFGCAAWYPHQRKASARR